MVVERGSPRSCPLAVFEGGYPLVGGKDPSFSLKEPPPSGGPARNRRSWDISAVPEYRRTALIGMPKHRNAQGG